MVVLEMVVGELVQMLEAQTLMQTLDLAAVEVEVETHLLAVMAVPVSFSSHIPLDKYP